MINSVKGGTIRHKTDRLAAVGGMDKGVNCIEESSLCGMVTAVGRVVFVVVTGIKYVCLNTRKKDAL
jgi:hypothetical protein